MERLIGDGSNVNARNAEGETILHFAVKDPTNLVTSYIRFMDAEENIMKIITNNIQTLLMSGAEINAKSNDETTPLHEAAKWTDPKVIKCLIDNEANVYTRDKKGRTALHIAAGMGRNAKIIWTLVDAGSDVKSITSNGWTALHLYVEKMHTGATTVVEYLLDKGVDVLARTTDGGQTALDIVEAKPRQHDSEGGDRFVKVKELLRSRMAAATTATQEPS